MGISVIIPTYNEENNIGTCLRSLESQDYPGNYEVVVFDDSSTDRTTAIAKRYADRIIIDRKDTIAYGRQAGSSAARYEVLAYTDADTFIPSDWLSNLASSLEDRRVVGVHGKLLTLDGNRFENDFCEYVLSPYSQLMVNINKPSAPGSNFAVRKKVFHNVKGFNTKLVTAEDVDLCNRIKAHGKFVYNPDAVVYVSTRRVREWGYLKMLSFYTGNTLRYYTSGTAGKSYEPIR